MRRYVLDNEKRLNRPPHFIDYGIIFDEEDQEDNENSDVRTSPPLHVRSFSC